MYVLGLTGGIATGKTTVAGHLQDLGATIIEADEIARQVVTPGHPVLEQIAHTFGQRFLANSGGLDREKMADLIFGNVTARRKLNALMHPPMVELIEQRLEKLRQQSRTPIAVIVVAAVLYEMGLDRVVEAVIALTVRREIQVSRLIAKGMSRKEAEARIDAQTPYETLSGKSRWILPTEGSVLATFRQVEAIWQEITSQGTQ